MLLLQQGRHCPLLENKFVKIAYCRAMVQASAQMTCNKAKLA